MAADGTIKISTDLDTAGVSSAMGTLGSVIAKGAAVAVAALGTIAAAALKVGSDFEREMKNLQAITGMTSDEMQAMENGIRRIALESGRSVTEIAANAKMLAEAGGDIGLMMEQLVHGTNLAVATQSDMATTLDFLGSAMKTFGIGAEDTQKVVDSFAYVTTMANLELSQLAESYVNAGGSAAMAGMSIDEVNAILITFSNAGLKGGAAGTALNRMLADLSAPTTKAATALDSLGISLYNFDGSSRDVLDIMEDLEIALGGMNDEARNTYTSMIFSSVAQKGWNMVMNEGVGNIRELSNELYDTSEAFEGLGQAAGMAAIQNSSLQGTLSNLSGQLADMGITLYQKMKGPLSEAMSAAAVALAELGTSLREGQLSESFDRIAEGLSGFIAVVMDLAIRAIPYIINGLASFIDILSTVGEVIGRVFSTIISKIAESNIGENIEKIRESFSKLFAALSGSGGLLDGLISGFAKLVVTLLELVTSILPHVIDFFTWIVENMDTVGPILLAVAAGFAAFQVLTTIVPLITGLVSGISGIASAVAAAGGVLPALGSALAALVSPVGLVIAAIASLVAMFVYLFNTNDEFREKILTTWNNIKESLGSIIESIKNIFSGFWADLAESGTLQEMKETIMGVWEGIQEFFIAIFGGIFDLFSAVFGAIADFLEEHGETIKNSLVAAWEFAWGIIGPIINFIGDLISGLADIVKNAINIIVGIIEGDWEKVWESAGNVVSAFFGIFESLLMGLWEIIVNIFTSIGTWLKNKWEEIKENVTTTVKNMVDSVIKFFKELPYNIGKFVGEMIGHIIQFGIDFWDWVKNDLPRIIDDIIEWFAGLPGRIWEWLKNTINKFIDFFRDMRKEVNEQLPGIIDSIIQWFKDLPEKLFNIGKDMIQGLINGITGMVGNAINAVADVGRGILDGIKGVLGIHSPSKEFFDIAKNIGLGFVDGIRSMSSDIDKIMDEVFGDWDDIFDNMDSGFSANMPIDKMASAMDYGSTSMTSNNIDRGMVIYFTNEAPINSDMDLRDIAQKLGSYIYMEERSRGLVS